MRHYIRLDRAGCDAASLIYSTTPILGDQRYQPFSISAEAEAQCLEGDFGIIETRKGSKQSELFFLMKSDTEVFLLPSTSQLRLTSFADEVLSGISPQPTAIKELNAPGLSHNDIYMRYLALELNRATYTVSADFAYMQIPPEIASAALGTGVHGQVDAKSEDAEQLNKIQIRRYHNFYNKKKPNYQITSYCGVERFLDTGRTQGRFRGFREFTPLERISILSNMLENARANPNYHLHIFKDMNYQVKYTTIGFEKLGVSVFPKGNDEHERASFNYLFLTIPDFTQHFIEHYLSSMVGKYSYDKATSIEMLEGLLNGFKEKAGL